MLVRFFRRLLAFCWLLPGFLLWAAFPPMGEHFDCFFALAPLLWLSRNGTVKRSRWLWFVNGFVFWFATLSWMPAIVKNNGPWPLVVLGWACLAAYCSLYFGAFGWLSSLYWNWAKSKTPVSTSTSNLQPAAFRFLGLLIVEPVLWCGLELIRSTFLGGFAWNQLGVAPINVGFGSPAALGGVYLVSAVVILVNGTIASIAERFITRDRRWWRTLETFIPFALIFALYSFHSPAPSLSSTPQPLNLSTPQPLNPSTSQPLNPSTSQPLNLTTSSLSVALVQRNFPCCFKPQDRENPVEVYSNLCANVAYLKPDVLILPESAYAEIAPLDHPSASRFSQWLMQYTGAKAVLAGGGRYTQDKKAYNSAALYLSELSPNPQLLNPQLPNPQLYDKVHLVPFGEFIPGDKIFPALQKLAPVGSCTPGELKLLHLPQPQSSTSTLPLGIAICYEDTDSAQMRELAKRGAKALVFITNDSWFSCSQETISHAWQATARAIETGLPVIRVGNSGVSGVIYPDGKANWLSDYDGHPLVDAPGTLFDRIQLPNVQTPNPPNAQTSKHPNIQTPYVRLGDWPLGLAFALLISGYILIYLINTYEQRRIVSLQVG